MYLSQTGAFNGSGIALSSNSFGVGGYGVINVYYQHWNSELRRLQLMKDGSWQAADRWATDAKNGTPISAVSYALDNKATVCISNRPPKMAILTGTVAFVLH